VKIYQGIREGYAVTVTVNGRFLNPRLDLWNHSPTGFEWGYGGSGPAEVALGVLADHLGKDDEVIVLHQDFKQKVITGLPHRNWTLTTEQIQTTSSALRAGST